MNGLLTASEVSQVLRIHVNTVYYYLETEKLRGHRVIGNRWRIKEADLESFVNGAEPKHRRHIKEDFNSSEQVADSAPTSKKDKEINNVS